MRNTLLLFVLALFVLVAVFSFHIASSDGICIEKFQANIQLFRLINSHHSPALDVFFLVVRFAGSGWGLLIILGFVMLYRREKAGVFLISIAIAAIYANLLKQMTSQPRPDLLLTGVHLLVHLYHNSFPSADTATAFAAAFALIRNESRWLRVCLLSFCILVGYGRIYVGVHFPLDVMVGAGIGVISAIAAHAILSLPIRRSNYKDGFVSVDVHS